MVAPPRVARQARPGARAGAAHGRRRRRGRGGRRRTHRRHGARARAVPCRGSEPQAGGMRIVFLVLLFANVAFFAYRYYVTQLAVPASDPVAQQIQPDRVRIVPPGELARLAASRRGVCIELGPIATAEAARAEEAAGALAGGLKISQRRVDDTSRWWVYIPPLPTRAAVNQRVAELKKQGVADSQLISDDSVWRNAISLGVFSSEDAASRRLDDLVRRGVRGAQSAPREGRGTRVYLQLRDAPERVRLKFVDLKEGFPDADVRECPGG